MASTDTITVKPLEHIKLRVSFGAAFGWLAGHIMHLAGWIAGTDVEVSIDGED